MADDISSWLAQALIDHDKDHGANKDIHLNGRYVQLIEFSSYRTKFDPEAEIRGIVQDKTHWVKVRFDIDVTNAFEQPKDGVPGESLTSNLRAVFRLSSFRIELLPPAQARRNSGTPSLPETELPQVVLLVRDFTVGSGSRDEPVYWHNTHELGKGTSAVEGELQKVLRSWWFGESNSDPSQNLSSQLQTPSRPSLSNPKALISSPMQPDQVKAGSMTMPASSPNIKPSTDGPRASDGLAPLETLTSFLKPYLNPPQGGKKKVVPEWLFEMPGEAKRQLQDITMFGLDLSDLAELDEDLSLSLRFNDIVTAPEAKEHGLHGIEDHDANKSSLQPATKSHEGQGEASRNGRDEDSHNEMLTAESAARMPASLQVIASAVTVSASGPNVHPAPENESDDDILIRPPAAKRSKLTEMFDPLAMPSPSPAPSEMINEDESIGDGNNHQRLTPYQKGKRAMPDTETDEDELSDYEREQRRQGKAQAIRSYRIQKDSVTSASHHDMTLSASSPERSARPASEVSEAITPTRRNGVSLDISSGGQDPEAETVEDSAETDVDEQDAAEADELVPESNSLSIPIRVAPESEGGLSGEEAVTKSATGSAPVAPITRNERQPHILVDDSDQSLPQPSLQGESSGSRPRTLPATPYLETNLKIEPVTTPAPARAESGGAPQSGNLQDGALTRVKVEHITPAAGSQQSLSQSLATQSSGKGSRRSFLQSIKLIKVKTEPEAEQHRNATLSPTVDKGKGKMRESGNLLVHDRDTPSFPELGASPDDDEGYRNESSRKRKMDQDASHSLDRSPSRRASSVISGAYDTPQFGRTASNDLPFALPSSVSPVRETASPEKDPRSQHGQRSASPVRQRRLLDGFRLNLQIDGLTEGNIAHIERSTQEARLRSSGVKFKRGSMAVPSKRA
ncbi:hypothetical protein IAU60_005164 [Kwoniella sp. DSM 27419]